jgi:hypothetical protein
MTRQVEAVYENGVLRPLEPLPFEEHQRVTVTVASEPLASGDPFAPYLDREFAATLRSQLAAMASPPPIEEVRAITARDPESWSDLILSEREERL